MFEKRLSNDKRLLKKTIPQVLLFRERLVHGLLVLCTTIPVVGIGMVFFVFVYQSILFFQEVSVWQFLTDGQWTPLFSTRKFGVGVLISATLLITAIALLVAIPLGTLAAIYLGEYAPPTIRRLLKPFLEALAGVPTIVYGYFALQFISPSLRHIFPDISAFNGLSAGLVTGALIIPIISSLSEDAIRNVPDDLREGAYATGLTQFETMMSVVFPAALPGIVASYTLATSRALGETMIAAIAAGQNPTLTFNPFVPIESMTSFIVQVSLGDVAADSLAFHTIFAVGLVLFCITLALNYVGQSMVRRYLSMMTNLFVPIAELKVLSQPAAMLSQASSTVSIDDATVSHYGDSSELDSGELTSQETVYPEFLVQKNEFQPQHDTRIRLNRLIVLMGGVAATVGWMIFVLLLFGTFRDGFARLDWQFLVSYVSRDAEKAGIFQALVGTLWLMVVPAILVVPVGVGAAIYLEEYMPRGRLSRFLELNIANATAVPSILYGIMGLALFVRHLEPITSGRSLLSASLVMAIIALPLLIIAVQSAFRSIPTDLHHAAYAVGMTRSQMIWTVSLPHAFPGVITGILLALSRIIGETSAVLAIGALAFVNFSPSLSLDGLQSPFTTLPTQIFFWAIRPQETFQANAAAAIIVLGIMVLVMNIAAVLIRDFYRRWY